MPLPVPPTRHRNVRPVSLLRYRLGPKAWIGTATVGDIIGLVPDDGLGVLNSPCHLAKKDRGDRDGHLS